MLQEIEKIREFHFVKKCKLGNEGCHKLIERDPAGKFLLTEVPLPKDTRMGYN
jgi:hypothetical protein